MLCASGVLTRPDKPYRVMVATRQAEHTSALAVQHPPPPPTDNASHISMKHTAWPYTCYPCCGHTQHCTEHMQTMHQTHATLQWRVHRLPLSHEQTHRTEHVTTDCIPRAEAARVATRDGCNIAFTSHNTHATLHDSNAWRTIPTCSIL